MERIPLSNRTFEGNNNAYLFADGPETVLVDTGDRLPGTHEQLAEKLDSYGVFLADIDRIFLTHWHGDHRGLAGPIQQESDATVYVHEADADLVAGDPTAWGDINDLQEEYFDQWGMPDDKRAEVTDVLDSVAWQEDAPDVTHIDDGETFAVNEYTLRVVHAPGHTSGLCLFELDDGDDTAVLSGDALLPKYTPNVGGADIRVDNPLQQYLDTLRAIVAADYDVAWPGHRDRIDDPTGRAEHIISHHEERSYRVLDALRRLGPCDTWTVSDDLFGDLEHIHILHGPGESYAHLEHLESDGCVVREGNEYRLADGVADRLDQREDGRWPL
jgi:glyoxylase-like metal-dependent hydrolase (beta-lactamase superfamily II)